MKFVVDTNIVFSGILNSSGTIGKILIHSNDHIQFYSCDFLRIELFKHRNKLLKLTKLSASQLQEIEFLITSNIVFINEALLPQKLLISTEKLLIDIDVNDTPFVALTKHLKAKLWSGDKELLLGLQSKSFNDVITTSQLSDLLDSLET